jgi:hypothetical protein
MVLVLLERTSAISQGFKLGLAWRVRSTTGDSIDDRFLRDREDKPLHTPYK